MNERLHDSEWQRFVDRPASYADPSRLAACFSGAVSDDGCKTLLATKRLQDRLSDLLVARLGLAGRVEDDLDEVDRRLALASGGDLSEIAQRAGAIYWSGSLAGIIQGSLAATLQAQLGEEFFAFALANRDLSGPRQMLEPVEDIDERIAVDGWKCLGGWCRVLPADVAMRIRLKLPAGSRIDEAPQPPFDEAGPPIVRRAAQAEI